MFYEKYYDGCRLSLNKNNKSKYPNYEVEKHQRCVIYVIIVKLLLHGENDNNDYPKGFNNTLRYEIINTEIGNERQ